VVRELPVPMVALVATAVSVIFFTWLFCTNLKHQLYATIHEWRTGTYQATEFSANVYLDVYVGHIRTMDHILKNRVGAFHRMMGDLYAQAR
jgi:hypothetical protein